MKKTFVKLTIVALVLGAVSHSTMAQDKTQEKPQIELKTASDSLSYAIGVRMGEGIKQGFGTKIVNPEIIAQAIRECFDSETLINIMDADNYIKYFMENIQDTLLGNENERRGYEFFDKLADREGITSTNSGLYYQILEKGNGETIKEGDQVVMNFVMGNIDGDIIDSTEKHGKPFEFTYKKGALIEGCYEGLEYARKGTKMTIYIPYVLAYGEKGTGPIGPKESLIFDVEILDVTKAEK